MTDRTVNLLIRANAREVAKAGRDGTAAIAGMASAAVVEGRRAETGLAQASRGADQLGQRATGAAQRIATSMRQGSAAVRAFANDAIAQGARAQAALEQTGRGAGAITGHLGAARATLIGFFSIQAATRGAAFLAGQADHYANLTARIKLATSSQQEYVSAEAEVFAIAQRTSTALESTATLYSRINAALKDQGGTQRETLKLTETVNKALAISGASSSESAGAVVQLAQAFSAGALRGDEFNSVNEAAPRLMQALAASLGVTRGQLRALAEDGKLTSDKLRAAFSGAEADKIGAEYDKLPLTIERSMTRLSNAVTRFIGQADQVNGVSSVIAGTLAGAAANFDVVADAVGILAVALASRLVVSLTATAAAKARDVLLSRQQVQAELQAAQAAEAAARAQVDRTRGLVMGGVASSRLVAAEATLAAAQARTAVATEAAARAATAKSIAMRGLNAVMSAFGGPIGIAITSLVLLTSYLNTVEEESKRVTQEIAQGFRGARQALDAFNKTPSAGAVDSLSEVPDQIEKIKARLVELRALGTEGLGDVSGSLAESIRLTNEEIKFNELRLVALSKGYDRAVQSVADMIQQTAGVQRPTAQARQEIVSLADSIVRSGVDMDTARPKIEALIEKLFGAEAAARAAAAGLRDIRASANLGGIADKLNEEIGKLRGDQSELLYGKAFRMREEFEQSLLKAEAGKAPREEVQRLRELNAERIRLTQENDRARESQRGVSRGHREAATEAKQQATEIKRLSEAQRQFREETARMVAANQGPLFAAQAAAAQAADAARRSAVTDKLNPVDLQVRLDAIDADFKRRVQEMIASGNQQLMQATGRYVEAATTEAAQKYQQTIDYFSSIGDGRGDVFKELFKTDVAKAELEQLDREVQTLFNNLQRQEQSLQTQVQSGLITEFTGRRELLRLYREQGGAIEALLPRMDGLARSIGDPSAVENVARVRSELERMQSTTNLLQQSIATTFQGSFSNLLNTLTEGTSSLRDAVTGFLLDMTRGIAQFAAAQTAQAAQAALLKRFGSGVDAAAGGAAAAVTATAITTATAAGAATLGTGIVTGAGAGGATIAAAVSTSAVAAATAIGVAITTAGATAAANMAAAIAGSSALTAGFADGGYTGPGSKYAPKGIVHAGEYVIRASSVRRYGMGLFDALNQGRYPHAPMRTIRAPRASYAEGGLVGGVSSPVLQQRIKVNSIFDINHVIRAVVKSSDFEREVVNVVNLNQHSIGR